MEDLKVRVLLEENRQQFKTIAEGLAILLPMNEDIKVIKKDIVLLKEDMSLVKLTLSGHSKILANYGKKIDALFEMVAQNTVDIGTIKTKITKIEEELKSIKNLVKDKADKEKVQKLEENILTLKRKIA